MTAGKPKTVEPTPEQLASGNYRKTLVTTGIACSKVS